MSDIRLDGYQNAVLGHGLKNKDPAAHFLFSPGNLLTEQMLTSLFVGNSIARKIVSLPADEATKNWIKVEGDDDDCRALQMLDDLGAEIHFSDGVRWSRLFGGSAILMMANDGRLLSDPLNEKNLYSIDELRVYDRSQIFWNDAVLYEDPRNTKYGRPEIYQINPIMGMPFLVHESRLLLFTGDPLPEYRRLQTQGWGMNALQGMTDEVFRNDHGHDLAIKIVERVSQGILKLDGLLQKLMDEDGEAEVKKRLDLIDMARSVLNTVAIDKEDDFDLKNISMSQLPELLDRFGLAVSAASNIPFTLLFGRSPAGMNSTGKSDLENWYGFVGQIQKRQLKKPLDRLVYLLQLCKNGLFKGKQLEKWAVKFNPLWVPSEKEQADTKKTEADADKAKAEERQVYVNMGALDPSEVRQKLSDEGEYDIDPTVMPVQPNTDELKPEDDDDETKAA